MSGKYTYPSTYGQRVNPSTTPSLTPRVRSVSAQDAALDAWERGLVERIEQMCYNRRVEEEGRDGRKKQGADAAGVPVWGGCRDRPAGGFAAADALGGGFRRVAGGAGAQVHTEHQQASENHLAAAAAGEGGHALGA